MKSTFHKTLALTLSVSLLAAYTPGFATEVIDDTQTITDTFSEQSGSWGGALSITSTADVTIDTSSFTNNHATGGGGAIDNEGLLYIKDSSFTGNTSEQYGGALTLMNKVIIENSTFTNNQTLGADGGDSQGGAILQFKNSTLEEDPYTLTVTNSTFEGNVADIGTGGGATGGAIDIYAKADFDNVTFTNNSVKTSDELDGGGAVHMGSWSKVTFANSNFTGNSSQTNGGALRTRNGRWLNTQKNDNSAALLDITNTTFTGNQADLNGGAFYNNFYNSTTTNNSVYIANATFVQNTATNGGAIYNDGETDYQSNPGAITIKDATFTGNTASANGGAIYNGGTLTLAGTNTFTGNTAAEGADIYNTGSLIINDTTTLDGGIAGNGTVNVNGTLNIAQAEVKAGALTFANGSTLGVEFGNDTTGKLTADTLTIGENAEDRANLQVTLSKDFLTTDITQHTLTDAAIQNGKFALANASNVLYNVSFDDSTNVVTTQRKSQEEQKEAVEQAGGTDNDVAVLAAYTATSNLGNNTANQVADIINTLAQTDIAAAVAVTQTVAPEVAPAKQAVQTAVLGEVLGALQNRMTAATASAPATYALGDAKDYKSADTEKFSVWTQGLLNKSHKEATSQAGAFTGRSTGIAAGADMHVGEYGLVGAGYAYTHTNVSSTGRHNRILGDTFFLYGQYRPSAFYVQGSVAYGDSKYEEKKYLPGLTLGADYHVQSYSAQALAGYDVTDWLSPNLGLRYTRLHQEGYNDGAQNISADNANYLTAMLGTTFQMEKRLSQHVSLLPHLYTGLAYDLVSDDNNSRVTLPNSTGYNVAGERLHRLSFEVGAGFTAHIYQNVEAVAAYEGSFREDYNSHTGTLKLRYLF